MSVAAPNGGELLRAAVLWSAFSPGATPQQPVGGLTLLLNNAELVP